MPVYHQPYPLHAPPHCYLRARARFANWFLFGKKWGTLFFLSRASFATTTCVLEVLVGVIGWLYIVVTGRDTGENLSVIHFEVTSAMRIQ